jgi:hypothetical protein
VNGSVSETAKEMTRHSSLNDPGFELTVTLRDAYLIMEQFVSNYHARGDTPVSDFLFVYLTILRDGQTTDPAAADDFLNAARAVLENRDDRRAR